ncbi:unnamed protein product, partial [marine sediment metagenome]
VRYDLGKPRYDPDECRQLRLTYGRPLRVWLRLTREQPIEEEVYLGDVPIMMGGGYCGGTMGFDHHSAHTLKR